VATFLQTGGLYRGYIPTNRRAIPWLRPYKQEEYWILRNDVLKRGNKQYFLLCAFIYFRFRLALSLSESDLEGDMRHMTSGWVSD
jgi:hypothetical protein